MIWKTLIIPAVTIGVATLGSTFTTAGMDWYKTINLPSWTPPGSVIGTVWTVIFILATLSAILARNYPGHKFAKRIPLIMYLFVLNAVLNVGWSLVFFRLHLLGWAIWEAAFLGASVVVIIVLLWPISRIAAYLLIPYAAWVAFATYLNTTIWWLNR
jgi:tryptophan-rich sensory protein